MSGRISKILIVFAHPKLESSKINQRLLRALGKCEGVTIRDLYELYPDYQIDVQEEQVQLLKHDLLIWHHPLYWYSSPPIMKMWIDEVLEHNWAYGPNGVMLRGKYAMNLITAGGSDKSYSSSGTNHFSIREFLRPFEQTARLCRMNYLPPFAILGAYRQTEQTLVENEQQLLGFIEKFKTGSIDLEALSNELYINTLIEKK